VPSWSWASLDRAVMCDPYKTFRKFYLLAAAAADGRLPLREEHDGSLNPFVVCNRLRLTSQILLSLTDVVESVRNPKDGTRPFKVYVNIADRAIVASRSEMHLPAISKASTPDGTIKQRKLSAYPCDSHSMDALLEYSGRSTGQSIKPRRKQYLFTHWDVRSLVQQRYGATCHFSSPYRDKQGWRRMGCIYFLTGRQY
jgi:hypothetical protein